MDVAPDLFDRLPTQRLGDQVYAHLIEAIATNRLPQDAKIQEDVLATQMGISKTPVREALRRLEAEGFVRVYPYRTPEVRRLEPQDIDDLYGVREYLERLAVRSIAELRPEAVLVEMEAIQAAADVRLREDAPIEIGESVTYNRRFHGLVLQGASNKRLQRLYQLIDVDVRRLSYQSVSVTGRQRDAIVQHRAILDAIKVGDADLAETLMVQHIRQARRDLLIQIRRAPKAEGQP